MALSIQNGKFVNTVSRGERIKAKASVDRLVQAADQLAFGADSQAFNAREKTMINKIAEMAKTLRASLASNA